MAGAAAHLGELELEVLKMVWRIQPCTVQEAADVLGPRRGCARTTVLTVMQRLHAKGFLKRRKQGGVFRYAATAPRGKVLSRLIRRFVAEVLDGSPAPFVAYLAEEGKLTPEQAAALRQLAERIPRKSSEGRRQ